MLLEADKRQHKHYGISCDAARMLDVFAKQMKQGRAGKFHFVLFEADKDCEKQRLLLRDHMAKLLAAFGTGP